MGSAIKIFLQQMWRAIMGWLGGKGQGLQRVVIIAALMLIIGAASLLIHGFVSAYAAAGDGPREAISGLLTTLTKDLRSERDRPGSRIAQDMGELAEDVEHLRVAIDSHASLSTARVNVRLKELSDAIDDRLTKLVVEVNTAAEPDGNPGPASVQAPVGGTGAAADSGSGHSTATAGAVAGTDDVVATSDEDSGGDEARLEAELDALTNAARQVQHMQTVNLDLMDDHVDTYLTPWFRRKLKDAYVSVSIFIVCVGGLLMCTFVPLLLAWREIDAGVNTVARLRARGLKVEIIGAVVFVVAAGSLVIGAIAFVQVNNLVASDAELAKGIQETKQRLAMQESDQQLRNRGQALEGSIARYGELLAEAEQGLESERAKIRALRDRRADQVVPILQQELAGDAASRSLIEQWADMTRKMEQADKDFRDAPPGSKVESKAQRDFEKHGNRLSALVSSSAKLKNALDVATTKLTAEEEVLRGSFSRLEQRIQQLQELRSRLEQEKIRIDVEAYDPGRLSVAPSDRVATSDVVAKELATASSPVQVGEQTALAKAQPLEDAKAPPKALASDVSTGVSSSVPVTSTKPEQSEDSTFSFDLQVILTRAGISVFTLFLVQMLLGLQRYITRLAGYYYGRADALELINARADGEGAIVFGNLEYASTQERRELLDSMSPMAVDYAKTVPPNKELVDLAKTMIADSVRRGR